MATNYKDLYYSTDDILSKFKPSLSSYFNVFIPGKSGKAENEDINFLAYEAVLPGTSYQTTEVYGDRQGITETFANKRTYLPVDISFYIDYDYSVIEYFEQWMGSISPNLGEYGETDSYVKFNYPEVSDEGKKRDIQITKFERNFRSKDQRLVKGGVYNMPDNRIEYTLLGAYPTNIIAIPVSYESSNILRTTITFNYNLYRFKRYTEGKSQSETLFSGKATNSADPGNDTATTSTAVSIPAIPAPTATTTIPTQPATGGAPLRDEPLW